MSLDFKTIISIMITLNSLLAQLVRALSKVVGVLAGEYKPHELGKLVTINKTKVTGSNPVGATHLNISNNLRMD